jgi:hypothetical protein
MTISKIEQNELPEYLVPFTLTYMATVAGSTGQVILAAAGHHPKCRFVRGQVTSQAATTTGDQYVVEDGDGNDATAAALQSLTANTPTAFVPIAGQYFDRTEAICINRTVVGNAANACFVIVQFESID